MVAVSVSAYRGAVSEFGLYEGEGEAESGCSDGDDDCEDADDSDDAWNE